MRAMEGADFMFRKRFQGEWWELGKIVLAILGSVVIFAFILERFTYRSRCEYFEGVITEKTDEYIMFQIEESEESSALIDVVGNEIKIGKDCFHRQEVFALAGEGARVRVAYNWIYVKDMAEKKLYLYSIYDKDGTG